MVSEAAKISKKTGKAYSAHQVLQESNQYIWSWALTEKIPDELLF